MSAYLFVIGLCVIIIISFIFNLVARKTNIPSVLMLIGLGMGLRQFLNYYGIEPEYFNTLEILGIVGLIMIVLEAALDLEIRREKWPIIWKSFLIALVALVGTSFLISAVIQLFIQNIGFLPSLIYAIPLSIMSSAIIIPSVRSLTGHKREFMIYESTFSDILGIMFFYFIIENFHLNSAGSFALVLSGNILITMVLSIVLSILLLLIIQNVKAQARFFLFLSVLVLLYAVGKLFHLSSLLIILVFGLLLGNYKVLLFGRLKRMFKDEAIDGLLENFKMITVETSFVVRTFFFVVFGISMSLVSLTHPQIWIMSGVFIGILYVVRIVCFLLIDRKDFMPQIFLAPRGLISILLFYAIPEQFIVSEFENGILLLVILVSSLIMALALIVGPKNKQAAAPLGQGIE